MKRKKGIVPLFNVSLFINVLSILLGLNQVVLDGDSSSYIWKMLQSLSNIVHPQCTQVLACSACDVYCFDADMVVHDQRKKGPPSHVHILLTKIPFFFFLLLKSVPRLSVHTTRKNIRHEGKKCRSFALGVKEFNKLLIG